VKEEHREAVKEAVNGELKQHDQTKKKTDTSIVQKQQQHTTIES
jgi:hypothetical protein